MIEAGADLVIGHGAHMMGEVLRHYGTWAVFSIGNFVFNSPGSYGELAVPPSSFACQLVFSASDAGVSRSLRLYPILSDNERTAYQPRFVNAGEMQTVHQLLLEKSPPLPPQSLKRAEDEIGAYLQLDFATPNMAHTDVDIQPSN